MSVAPSIRYSLNGGAYQVVDLRTLGEFDFNESSGTESDIPVLLRKLDGKRVSVQGMMWDLRSSGPASSRFQLVYSLRQSHRGPPLVQERIFVHGTGGRPIQWFDQLVRVRGTFHAHMRRDDTGAIREVFTITDPTVDAVPAVLPQPEASRAWIWGVLVTAVLIVVGLRRRLQRIWDDASQRRMQRNAGFCRRCGYDLRASIVRCPECGTPFTAPWRFGADALLPGAITNLPQHATNDPTPCVPVHPSKP